jgi:hypothetical protein
MCKSLGNQRHMEAALKLEVNICICVHIYIYVLMHTHRGNFPISESVLYRQITVAGERSHFKQSSKPEMVEFYREKKKKKRKTVLNTK